MIKTTQKPQLDPTTVSRARQLRHEATFPEHLLWSRLRGKRLLGLRWRRQHPIGPYIADFFCHRAKLVVELDRQSHIGTGPQDSKRSAYLNTQGLSVLRFTNDEVLSDLDAVLTRIAQVCRSPKPDADPGDNRQAQGPITNHPGFNLSHP